MPIPKKYQPLVDLVKKVTGTPGVSLTSEQIKALTAKSPQLMESYKEFRKVFNTDLVAAIKSYCGTKIKPFPPLEKKLASLGLDGGFIKGFTGLIDAKGVLYTEDGEAIEGRPAANNFPTVKMNPDNDTDKSWIFRAMRPDGSGGPHFYTHSYKKDVHTTKYQNVKSMDVVALRNKWVAYVKKFDITSQKSVACVVLEMLWQFTARIGTPGRSTYGVCTILVKHVKKAPQGYVISYPGKDSIKAIHKLVSSNKEHVPLIKAITQLIEGKGPNDRVFTYTRDDGRPVMITPAYVNQIWKANGGIETVHKIRTFTASRLFESEMQSLFAKGMPKTKKDAAEAFKTLAETVGKLLNHVRRTANGEKITGATALKSYIDSDLQVAYWHTVGFPLPKYLQEFATALGPS